MKTRPLSAPLARLVWLCMAPMVLVAVWLAWQNLRQQDEEQLSQARNLALNIAAGTDVLLEERIRALNMLATSQLADDERNWQQLYDEARHFVSNFGSHVVFADQHGRMLFNTRQPYGTALPTPPTAKGQQAAPLAISTGKPQVGDIVLGPVANVPLVAVAVPVLRVGMPTRAMLSTIETRRFQQSLEQYALPQGWVISLRDGIGEPIARRAPPGFDSARDVSPDHRIEIRSAVSPWSVSLEIPRTVDWSSRRQTAFFLGASVLLSVLVGLAGGMWATRRIGTQVAMLGDVDAGTTDADVEIEEIAAARRRIMESAARIEASDSRLRLWGEAFRNAQVGVVITDARTNSVVSVNAAFARQRGFTEEELIGRNPLELFPEGSREDFKSVFAARYHQAHFVVEAEHIRKDGSRFPVQIDLTVIRDPQGSPINRLALVLDISDRKRAEQELVERQASALEQQRAARIAALNLMDDAQAAKRQAEAAAEELRKLSQAVEQSVESIEITDLNARITYVNEAFVRQSGYSRAEIIGRNPRFLQSGKTPRGFYVELWSALQLGKAWRGELYNRRKDGSEYIESATITPIRRPDGLVTHYVAVKEDITERKRMSAELETYRHHLEELVADRTVELEQARATAESANRAKSTFLASMSHEIRTPMNAILGFTHMLRRDAASSLEADRLDKIDSAARHLLSVINDILDLSKIEAGRIELESHDFTLDAVLGHVATLIGEDASAKGLLVRVEGGVGPLWLRGDLTRVRQALLNLAANAVKFTEKGDITLRARMLESGDSRCVVQFEVQDTGIGIDPEVVPQLFQAFQQADASTTRRFGGTGLGLAITRQLALAMGGEAGVESTPGVGSRFWFRVVLQRGTPVRAASTSTRAGADELRLRHAGARVLLVEDHAINREVAADLLQAAGLVVETAENGRVAVAKVRDSRYALVLMDMLMPEMDGLQATRVIREMPQGRTVPIIAMTANAFEEDRQACRAAGMNDFLAKPINLQALYSTLDKWLSQPGAALAEGSARIMARLSQEAGVDARRDLASSTGKQGKLIKLLRMMATAHRDDMQKLQHHLQRGEHEDALGIAHTLRGVSAMLGANALFDAVGAVDTALKAHPGTTPAGLPDLIIAVNLQLDRLLEIVGNAPDSPAGPASAKETG